MFSFDFSKVLISILEEISNMKPIEIPIIDKIVLLFRDLRKLFAKEKIKLIMKYLPLFQLF